MGGIAKNRVPRRHDRRENLSVPVPALDQADHPARRKPPVASACFAAPAAAEAHRLFEAAPVFAANLRAAATKENAAFYQRVAPTAGKILGVKVPVIRAQVKTFTAANRDLSVDDAIALSDQAFESRCREEQLFAAFLLARYKRQLGPDAWPAVNRWVDTIDNWEACDQLAMGVAGEIVARHPQLAHDLEKWATSRNPWRRRFAVACTTVLNQKGRTDASAALRVCELLVDEADRSVAKAVGWALRDA